MNNLYINRNTDGLYEIVKRTKEEIHYRLFSHGIVKQPSNICSSFFFWLNFKKKLMTEDDTFDVLRRIPFREMEKLYWKLHPEFYSKEEGDLFSKNGWTTKTFYTEVANRHHD